MKWMKKIVRIFLKILKWAGVAILAALVVSGIYNTTLPESSTVTDRLTSDQKIYIAEYMHLQDEVMDELWPDYTTSFPAIVYNEEYAFLTGLQDPEPGWTKMPSEEHRGTEWEVVDGDLFMGEPYYRQPLPDPDITPENFTVKVGDEWVSTLQTREYAEVSFYNGFKNELPPVINLVFPYKLFWNLVMGDAENYVTGLIHEGFHGYQASVAFDKFVEAESVSWMSGDYPWGQPDNRRGWETETDYLVGAYEADTPDERIEMAEAFINFREERRQQAGLDDSFIGYEKKREWLEGLAKYTELKIGVIAAGSPAYSPVEGAGEADGFEMYENKESYLANQLSEVSRAAARDGESRFYYGGMMQAMVLDQLSPEWRNRVMDEEVFLEDEIRMALNQTE
jgi:hypothetical protein